MNEEIFETIYFAAVTSSMEMAKVKGTYATYKGSPISLGEFQFNMWGVSEDDLSGRWDWKALSSNTGLPWSHGLIKRYKDGWDWAVLSSNIMLPWSKELVALHEDHWDWDRLSCNEALPWSFDLIERYESRWNYYGLNELSRAWLAMPSLKLSELAEVLGHFDPGPKSATFLGNDE